MLGKRHLAAAATLIFLVSSTAIASHFISSNSVDSGEIRFETFTQYSDARNWAVSNWNGPGTIVILPNDAFHFNDLTWRDVNLCNSGWDGRYVPQAGADLIELNICALSSYNDTKKRAVATHELGHALGLGDHSLSDFNSSSIIMFHCSTCSGITIPQAHDWNDYDVLW